MADNIFAQGMNAFNTSYDAQKQIGQDRAQIQAGRQIAGGDYDAGAATLNSAGMLDPAHNVLADNLFLQDRRTADQNLADDRAKKDQADKLTGLSKLTDAVQAVPEGQRAAWLKDQLPSLQQLGLPVDQIANLNEAQLTNVALKPWKAALGKAKLTFMKVGDNQVGVDDQGTVGAVFKGNVVAKKDENIYAPDDPGYGGPAPAAQAPPVNAPAATPALAPTGPAPTSARGVRNNNPLNITGQGWNGQTGSDGRFATFSTPEAGFAAADRNLITYATKHGINTLAGVINRWAPAGDGDNNPQTYIQTVAKDTGIDPNAPLNLADPKVRAIVLHSMSKVELGGSGSSTALAGINPQGTAPTLQGGAGGDDLGQAPAGYHLLASGPKDPDEAPLTKAAIDMNATQVAMTGKMPTMGMGKAANANRTAVQNRAAELIKEWGVIPEDWVTGVAQFKIAQGSLGKISQTRNMVQASENAVVSNMNNVVLPLMAKAAPGGIPFLNKYVMAVRDKAFGDPDVKAYDGAMHTVADEYAKVMTTTTGTGGSGTSDSARQEAYRRLSTAQTPAQVREVFSTLQSEMANRRSALVQQEQALTAQLRTGLAPAGQTAGASPLPAPATAPATRPPLASFDRR